MLVVHNEMLWNDDEYLFVFENRNICWKCFNKFRLGKN